MNYNIRYYPLYYASTSFLAWLPIFFLYFNSILSLKDVLLLEALYYIAVVILEVPTGYLSDLIGRKKTLVAGAIALCLACVFFLIGKSFWTLAIGQICFAFHMAFVSGTNTVFHFESLKSVGREQEYGDREAMVHKYGMIIGGTAALLGGWIASYGLYWAYVLTMIGATFALVISLFFVEPTIEEEAAESSILLQLKSTLSYLRQGDLAWVFLFYVVLFALSHVPYEFYQPYLNLLSEDKSFFGLSVPMAAGVIYAGARYIAAISSGMSMKWSRAWGLPTFLMFHMVFMILIIFAMSSSLHYLVAVLVLLRSVPYAAIQPPINAKITPAITAGQRATFHSVLSLASRLSFFVTLALLSIAVDKEALSDWPNLQMILRYCVIGGVVLMIPLLITVKKYLSTESK